MDPRTAARAQAWTTALMDGLSVGGWLAARELDDRPWSRRAARAGLVTAYLAHASGAELAWQLRVGPEHPAAARDDRALGQGLAVAAVATAVVWPLERPLPLALERRGIDRPHLVVGVGVGLLYALATLPVWRGEARRRVERWESSPPPADDDL